MCYVFICLCFHVLLFFVLIRNVLRVCLRLFGSCFHVICFMVLPVCLFIVFGPLGGVFLFVLFLGACLRFVLFVVVGCVVVYVFVFVVLCVKSFLLCVFPSVVVLCFGIGCVFVCVCLVCVFNVLCFMILSVCIVHCVGFFLGACFLMCLFVFL